MGKKILKKPMTDLLLPRASTNTRNKCRNSWKASGAGERWGIRFLGLPGRVVSRLGVQGQPKIGWGGRTRGEILFEFPVGVIFLAFANRGLFFALF